MQSVSTDAASPEAEARQALSAALVAAGAGDPSALRQVFDSTGAKLKGVILRILGDEAESEDVLQEVFLTVWRRADTYDPARASPVTWLATLARNRAIDRLRARKAPALPLEHADAEPDGAAPADAAMISSERLSALHGCLEVLDARQAGCIRAAFLEGATYPALAARHGAPLGTMKSLIRRGLLRLRACLEAAA